MFDIISEHKQEDEIMDNNKVMTSVSERRRAERRRRKRLQRQRQVRRNIGIFCLSIMSMMLVISASVLFISFSSQARSMDNPPSYKYFKSVRIEKGDTLWSIADSNMDIEHYDNTSDYIKEVKAMNALKSDNITAGEYIIVPYYSTEYVSNTN